MRLLYGTTTALVVTITEQFFGSLFLLYFADNFNASFQNPPSSNPFQLFLDYREICRTNDRRNPKFIDHKRAVRGGIRALISDPGDRNNALQTVSAMGIAAMQPYIAILEVDTYLQNRYPGGMIPVERFKLPPNLAGSPTAVEYKMVDIRGPALANTELHLEKIH